MLGKRRNHFLPIEIGLSALAIGSFGYLYHSDSHALLAHALLGGDTTSVHVLSVEASEQDDLLLPLVLSYSGNSTEQRHNLLMALVTAHLRQTPEDTPELLALKQTLAADFRAGTIEKFGNGLLLQLDYQAFVASQGRERRLLGNPRVHFNVTWTYGSSVLVASYNWAPVMRNPIYAQRSTPFSLVFADNGTVSRVDNKTIGPENIDFKSRIATPVQWSHANAVIIMNPTTQELILYAQTTPRLSLQSDSPYLRSWAELSAAQGAHILPVVAQNVLQGNRQLLQFSQPAIPR